MQIEDQLQSTSVLDLFSAFYRVQSTSLLNLFSASVPIQVFPHECGPHE